MRSVVGAVLIVTGCSANHSRTRGGPPLVRIAVAPASWCEPNASDPAAVGSNLFVLLVDKVIATARRPLAMTPWPLGDSPLIDDAEHARPDSQWQAVASSRRAILESKHVRIVSDAAMSHCPIAAQLVERRAGCPNESIELIAVGVARRGGAYYPGVIDDRASDGVQGVCAVRVVTTNIAPGGRVLAVLDYLFQQVAGRWQYVSAVPLLAEP